MTVLYKPHHVSEIIFCIRRRRHTRCSLLTGVQTCALPICLTSGDPKSDLPAALQEARRVGQRLSQACVSAIQDFTSASDNTFSGIKQTITARLNLWLNPMVDTATSESAFDLREVRRRRLSIYLGLSADHIHRSEARAVGNKWGNTWKSRVA